MNICVTVNSKYMRYLYVMLQSLYENNEKGSINLYILQRDFTDYDKKEILEITNKYENKVVYIWVNEHKFDDIPKYTGERKDLSLEIYFRLLIPELLPDTLDRVLMLDVDIIVNKDISELYNIDFEGKILAAAPNMCHNFEVETNWRIWYPNNRTNWIHYNTGVLMWNLDKIRKIYPKEYIFNQAWQHLDIETATFEEELFNVLFGDDLIKDISAEKWNYIVTHANIFEKPNFKIYNGVEKIEQQCAIIHYAAMNPWQEGVKNNSYTIWWRYAKKVPFYESLLEESYREAEGLIKKQNRLIEEKRRREEKEKEEKITSHDIIGSIAAEYDEIIIYGAGNIGLVIAAYMIEHGWREHIACCAVKKISGNPKKIFDIPVVELRRLPHFRETACFIIATAENKQTEIYRELTQFGCKNIRVIDYSFALEIEKYQKALQNSRSDLEILEARMWNLETKVNDIQYQILDLYEVCMTNRDTFKNYENCQYGKEVVITATGPSLVYYSPMKNAAHIGISHAWKRKDISYDYYFIQDGNRNYDYQEYLKNVINNVDCTIFMGKYLTGCALNHIEFPIQYGKGKDIRRYFVNPSLTNEVYQNICFHPLADFFSVVFPAFHFALYTHPKKIYLVGCDVSEGHFYKTDKDTLNPPLHYWKYGYVRMKEFAEKYYPETEIVSINPIGLKGLFQEIYTDKFLEKTSVIS